MKTQVILSDIKHKEEQGIIYFEESIQTEESISNRVYEFGETFKVKMLSLYIEKVRIYTDLKFEVSIEFGTTNNYLKSE